MAKSMNLYAQADTGSDGSILWGLADTKPVDPPGFKQTIDFQKNHSFDVTVELIDNTGLGLQFNSADPIWAQDGGSCPPMKGINTSEIPANKIGFPPNPSGPGLDFSILNFRNDNKKKGILIYQLNFVQSNGTPVNPQLDPEFKNGGGGSGLNISAAFVAVAGALAGTAAALITMPGASLTTIAGLAVGVGILAWALLLGIRSLRERAA